MRVDFFTNRGPQRSLNQDGIFINGAIYTEMEKPASQPISDLAALFCVVDGMGGMGGGEIATKIILQTLKKHEEDGFSAGCENLGRLLELCCRNLSIHAEKDPQLAFMGAVVAGMWINGNKALIFNCGDSRVYALSSGILQKLSHDHSVVQDLFDAGEIEEEEMRHHPRKNIVTSSISGYDRDPIIDCREIRVGKGDRFFICSDGVWENYDFAALENVFSGEPDIWPLKLATDGLATARDNFSFIIIEI